MKPYSKGMVFGVFDLFHEGHRHFLAEALEQCEELIAVVALPEMVQGTKGYSPINSLENRMTDVRSFSPHIKVVPGDRTSDSWEVLEKYMPDMIFLGYDQEALARALEKVCIPTRMLSSYIPEMYKTSLARKTK